MPDTLNKQSLINLLIDSPLREPIKINLIDIANNTSDADLPKIYSTITKELEIFQKATERRMKLADETIAKPSGGVVPTPAAAPAAQAPAMEPTPSTAPAPSLPPLDLPPLPQAPVAEPAPALSVPPLDLPPMPTAANAAATAPAPAPTPAPAPVAPPAPAAPTPEPAMPAMQPLGTPEPSLSSDEDALAEIQKELDSLKSATASEISSAAAPAPTK